MNVLSIVAYLAQGFNWEKLAKKQMKAPFVPKIKDDLDTSNFSEEFTSMIPAESPAIIPVHSEKIFKVRICYYW